MLEEFIQKYNGTSIDYDGVYGSQCTDLAKTWLSFLGYSVSGAWGNAKDWDKNAGKQGLVWVANTPSGVPRKGDLVVWGNGLYGHIAIFVGGDTSSFDSFDQNYPVGSVCKIVHHNYSNVKGWLHPTKLDTEDPKDTRIRELEGSLNECLNKPPVEKVIYIDKPVEVVKEIIKEVPIERIVYVEKELTDEQNKVLTVWEKIKQFLGRQL